MKCTCMNQLQYVTCHFFIERESIRGYIDTCTKIATNKNIDTAILQPLAWAWLCAIKSLKCNDMNPLRHGKHEHVPHTNLRS